MSPKTNLTPTQAKKAYLVHGSRLSVRKLPLCLLLICFLFPYLNPTTYMNPRQMFINTLNKVKALGVDTYKNPTLGDKYNKFSPELRTMIEAMANQESVNGKFREKVGDQRDGSNSYGLLHMGQDAVNEFNKRKKEFGYEGRDLTAKELKNDDEMQKFIQASRIDRDMKVNGRDLLTATQFIQNPGEANYGTSTLNKYKKTGKAVQDVINLYPNATQPI